MSCTHTEEMLSTKNLNEVVLRKRQQAFLKQSSHMKRSRIIARDGDRNLSRSEKQSPVSYRNDRSSYPYENLADIKTPQRILRDYLKNKVSIDKTNLFAPRKTKTPQRSAVGSPRVQRPVHRRIVSDSIHHVPNSLAASKLRLESSPKPFEILKVSSQNKSKRTNIAFLDLNHTPKKRQSKLCLHDSDPNVLLEFGLITHNFEQEEKANLISYIRAFFEKHGEEPPTTLEFYSIGKLIGKGAFGKVLLGVHKLTGQSVAMKAIDKAHLKNEHSRRKVFQEVYILKKVKHKNVVKILEVFETSKHFLMVFEYLGGGDLLHFVKSKGRLTEPESKGIFKQILEGASGIHSYSIIHRDFKLDNILIDSDYSNIKICDFGVSKLIKKGQIVREQCGTPAYLAPEIIVDQGYSGFTVDMWSLGVLLFTMVNGRVPFKAGNMGDLQKLILKGEYEIDRSFSIELQDFLSKLLELVPYKRLTSREAIDHPWFKSPDFEETIPEPRFLPKYQREVFSNRVKMSKFYTGETILAKVEELGYPREFVVNSLENNDLNHATATYFLLYEAIH